MVKAAEIIEKKVMIYCPCLDGHRQIYCDVLTEFFLSKGFYVVLMVGSCRNPDARKKENYISPYIRQYDTNPRVKIFFLDEQFLLKEGRFEMEGVRHLQAALGIGWTFFVDGDRLRRSFRLLRDFRKIRLQGKVCGIFDIATSFIYPRSLAGTSLLAHIVRVIKQAKAYITGNIFFRFILRKLWHFDVCFINDENFMKFFPYKEYHYFPDIYRSFRLTINRDHGFCKRFISEYRSFISADSEKDVVLYFGAADRRRGYDYLLKLSCEHDFLVFVHCGRLVPNEIYNYDIELFKRVLRSSGRLFELLDVFITDYEIIDELYAGAKYILLPYRNHYSSSGILVQAAEYGKPVLVPNIGIMNFLVTTHRIGLTFQHLSYTDFEKKFMMLRAGYDQYINNSREFASRFTKESIFSKLEDGLQFHHDNKV